LEYNSVIWSPYSVKDIQAIERVQRRFTKNLPGFRIYSYSEQLHRLNLQSVKLRRLLPDLVWCYKVVFAWSIQMLMISSHSVTQLSLEGTSINCTRSVQSLMYRLLSLENGLSTFGTLFQKMSILVHCCDLSAVFYVLIFLVL